jgi:pimeloyl-ACP methyl ester carboxylesterase
MFAEPSEITVVLVHGGAVSKHMFDDMAPLLSARGFHVVCPDLPGHGDEVEQGPFTFDKSTEALKGLLEKLRQSGRTKIILVGVSLGGQAVLHLLSAHPLLANAAVVTGSAIHPPSEEAPWEMPRMPESPGWVAKIMADVGKMGMAAAEAVREEAFRFELSVSQQCPPVLVVVGEHDVAMARRDFDELYQKLREKNPQCEKSVLQDSWHNHPIDVPQSFTELVYDWISVIEFP